MTDICNCQAVTGRHTADTRRTQEQGKYFVSEKY